MLSNQNTTYRRTDHASDPRLFDWTSANLPDRRAYFITDFDLVLRNRAGCIMIVEVKRKGVTEMKRPQEITYAIIADALEEISGTRREVQIGTWKVETDVVFLGRHLLTFENTFFDDGAAYWNGQPVTEQEVIDLLSFSFNPACCNTT